MSVADNAAQATGLGERLARARERRGLGLAQAAEKLHLEPRVLEALEAENFEALGAAVYVRGHLQRYADLVGEDAPGLQTLYAGRPHAHSTPDLTQVITDRNREAPAGARFGMWKVGLLTLLLVVGALIWWAMHSGPVPTTTTLALPPSAGDGAAQQPDVVVPAGVPPATAPRGAAAPAAVSAAPERAAQNVPRTEHPVAAAAVPAAPRSTEPAAPAPAVVPAPAAAAPAAVPAPAAAPAANAARLVLHFQEDSWAEVYDASGTALYRDIATAGAVQTLSGVPPLRLVLGNAAGVDISVNGRTVTLGALLQSTPNAQFQLDRGGRVTETH